MNSQTLLAFAPLRIGCSGRSSEPDPAHRVSVTKSTSKKISISTRRDAQSALFDYLHCTRGLSFVDSEQISKNSPRFLEHLLSKVKHEGDVVRALTRFFRYYPFNEFEPFLESLGLSRKDLASALPRNLMFLSDDANLLDNYHVLCNYGIPNSKIGKMYKEASEIFRYGDGVLNMKLRNFEKLGLFQSRVIDLVIRYPYLLLPGMDNDFVAVLEKLRELGFGSDWIDTHISSKHSCNWSRVLDTMCFLSEISDGNEQMMALIEANPGLVFEGKRAYLMVTQLVKLGLSRYAIYAVFKDCPKILSFKQANRIWIAIQFLLKIGMDRKSIATFVSTHIQLIASYSLKKPKFVSKNLSSSILEDPMNLFRLALEEEAEFSTQQNKLVNYVKKKEFFFSLGYAENSDEMKRLFTVVEARGDQLQDRFNCLVQAGLDRNDVIKMFRRAPRILNNSKEDIEKKIEILRNHSGYPVKTLVSFPTYLTYSNHRISCRFSMYDWAKGKGSVNPTLSLSTVIAGADARFVKYVVNGHPDGPAKWESLKKSILSS
ncbi:unnamed protein product [Cuscuta campestris]|uniref:Uncharacterized protein n=1 Tax=Cuscuta campestris TaxID=132261 RepID=A0A484NCV1_9ASTE|nr:unnamed protein product [Cuscuta campestris]